MSPSTKKTYRQMIREIFYRIRVHPYYQKIILLPLWIRIPFALGLFLFGVVGLVTPIPAGWIMILCSAVLIFSISTVKRYSVRLFFMMRLHRVAEWIRYTFRK